MADTIESLRAERDDADRRAGAAEREMESLKASIAARKAWLAKAKRDAGFSDNTSFDRVWEQALPLLLDTRNNKQPPAVDGMPVLDNGINTIIDGALEVVRKHDGGRHGLILNLKRLQDWLDLYIARAKAPEGPQAAWDWLTSHTTLELTYYRPTYADDDDLDEEWRVHRRSGSINDREWDLVGKGLSPQLAIEDARRTIELEKDQR
ncbi:hypothetical protein [Sphingobium lactosutens]|uniref:Uncharacterized protein n=1 Tax=Sphingobium lactosutens DS20 TaxID=1331060 RepID=T0HAC3_9SPHN|nr:hypothetical protein [Sphingobium lactosutens]EQB13271.1 hypothetical protein RLDS_16165 [Sphingobium lactosutens DS20]